MIKDALEGKPLRHPLHPFLVHFPVGLFTLSLILDLISLRYPLDGLYRGAFYAIVLGVICSLTAAIPGFADFLDIRKDHPAKHKARLHMILNLIMVALFAIDGWIRGQDLYFLRTPVLPLVLSIVGIILLSISGYIGCAMIYDDGIAVGRHRRRTQTPSQTIGIALRPNMRSEGPTAAQMVAVADADSLSEGESRRVDLSGTVIAVVKLDGAFYAFQEFCTHRFGPLSEGCLKDGQVECPWHRSRFHIRTGKVLHGPAKIDLKTYPVQIRQGKICIELTAARATSPARA